jgi:steroid delta-isomerase-like uncharacterized protein
MRKRLSRCCSVTLYVVVTIISFASFSLAQDSNTADVKAVAQQYYNEIQNQPDLDLASEAMTALLDPEFVFYTPNNPTPETGLEAHLEFLQEHVQGFPDGFFTIEEMIAEENVVAARWTFTGTNDGVFIGIPASGNSVAFWGMDLLRLDEEGHITEVRRYFDVLSLARQIDAL